MFPQTPHIECVALFERDQAAVAASEAAASEDAAVSAGEESD
jgi:hypothetical protein